MTQDELRPSHPASRVVRTSSALTRADDPQPDVEVLADELRTLCWSEGTFPVDPVVVATRMGLEVFSAHLDHDVMGVLLDDELVVAADLPPKRYRVVTATEVGHRVVTASGGHPVDAHISRRSESSAPAGPDAAARHFALALLVPADVLVQHDRAGMSELETAEFFGVSLLDLSTRRQLLAASGVRR